eukprot:4657181-Karenia_brevis.AAC.1
MSAHSSRANFADIHYTDGTLDHITTLGKSHSCSYLLHFGHIGQRHHIAPALILLIFARLGVHHTMSQDSTRANLADIC